METYYYTTGEFAKKANVSIRTIRYYDKQGILKPSYINESGYRYYSSKDFGRLQQILTLKYLGFSLEEIVDLMMNDSDSTFIQQSLELQLKLVRKKMEHSQVVEKSIQETRRMLQKDQEISWEEVTRLVQFMNMEQELVKQYKNANNINVRILLHEKYATNPLPWFRWIYQLLPIGSNQKVLEIGCGNGELWKLNKDLIREDISLTLSDISQGMLEDAKSRLANLPGKIAYERFDCQQIPHPDNQFDLVIANHVMFYVNQREQVLGELKRVLTNNGVFCCTTYGADHMREVEELVKEFDPRISLSEVRLFEVFGLETAEEELKRTFSQVELLPYEDELRVDHVSPLVDYIMSCHGNQRELLAGRQEEFRLFMQGKMEKKGWIQITKQAVLFRCHK